MDIAYRLYLGARNIGSRRFSRRDIAVVEEILNEHFHGWTTVKAVGRWQGKTEETLVITFTSHGIKSAAPIAGETGEAKVAESVERCVRRLKDHLGQESVLLEQSGAVGVWYTPAPFQGTSPRHDSLLSEKQKRPAKPGARCKTGTVSPELTSSAWRRTRRGG